MTYLIIIVALLVIAAPIMAVLPSPRDKARMVKRRRAMAVGVGVTITSIEDPDPDFKKYRSSTGKPLARKLSCAAYRLSRTQLLGQGDDQQSNWAVVRFAARNRAPLVGNWHWEAAAPGVELAAVAEFLAVQLAQLPADVFKIEEKNQLVSLYWHEDGEVQEVIDFLERCGKT
ncbi:MAG: hypothetical protein ACJAX5_002242 [Patiriisocius sp.]|jgi:hypothetical protein